MTKDISQFTPAERKVVVDELEKHDQIQLTPKAHEFLVFEHAIKQQKDYNMVVKSLTTSAGSEIVANVINSGKSDKEVVRAIAPTIAVSKMKQEARENELQYANTLKQI